jgi:PilZ domain
MSTVATPSKLVELEVPTTNRRRTGRIKMTLPVHVTGHASESEKWQEITKALDVSRTSLRFKLHQKPAIGLVLYLSFPMPWKLRQYSHSDPTYRVYTIVRRVEALKDNSYDVGVEFIGEQPPAAYQLKPWAVYKAAAPKTDDRRKTPRFSATHAIWVEYYDVKKVLVALEQGCTENVSKSGARICVMEPPNEFEFVKVFIPGKEFESFAKVTNYFMEKDGIYRLCVNFIGTELQL